MAPVKSFRPSTIACRGANNDIRPRRHNIDDRQRKPQTQLPGWLVNLQRLRDKDDRFHNSRTYPDTQAQIHLRILHKLGEPLPERPLQYLGTRNFIPCSIIELELKKDEMYTMVNEWKNKRGWCVVENFYGKRGWVPFNFLQVMPGVPWREADPPHSYETLYPDGPPAWVDRLLDNYKSQGLVSLEAAALRMHDFEGDTVMEGIAG